jgi:hypothetical protein
MLNMEFYGKSVNTVTLCCGQIIKVAPVTSYTVIGIPNVEEDDWGVPTTKK